MRIHRRITFSPPLAGALDDRASRIAAELNWHGFRRVGRVANEVTFRDPASTQARHDERIRVVRGGIVRLDPRGAHADIELRFSGWKVAWWVGVALVLAILPIPWVFRVLGLVKPLWNVVQGRLVVMRVAEWVRRAAQAP